jgi:hypothetical protein
MTLNLAPMETRRSSRGQVSAENTAEDSPFHCGNQNVMAPKERDIVIESRNNFRRGSGSVDNCSVDLRRKNSALQAPGDKLPDATLCTLGNSAFPIENTMRKHFTRNKRPKSPEKDETNDEQQNLVS